MARAHLGLPRPPRIVLSKLSLLTALAHLDTQPASRQRMLTLETAFRARIAAHSESLPLTDAKFRKFNTSPFVLLIHAFHRHYARISEIEADILPAKLFSSMETSAGRMIEAVMLPAHSWQCVQSSMHTANSALDGKCFQDSVLKLATLKSGPRCLNDEMSENFADAIISHAPVWATEHGVAEIEFTYGVLYGTPSLSNKKDWHILRNIAEKLPANQILQQPHNRWDCSFLVSGVRVNVAVRIGQAWWSYLGGPTCLLEMLVALIRACVVPCETPLAPPAFTIADLAQIVSTSTVPALYNVSLLQRSQLEWLFFIARHFCDALVETAPNGA